MRAVVNRHLDQGVVPAPATVARRFHERQPDYAVTPAVGLPGLAAELGIGTVTVKDETRRLGLPAFKALGASWAVERALAEAPGSRTLVAASAGNHGRAVAHIAARRGVAARIFVPERSLAVRRRAIEDEGAELVVITGTYQDAVAAAGKAAREPETLEIADVGDSQPARDVIDGYATLFDELARQTPLDVLLVPVGVGSLAAAAARFGAHAGVAVVGVEPAAAACLTASLAAGEPTATDTPGTAMAGMDCAEVSVAAWPSLRAGIAGTVTVEDRELDAATRTFSDAGIDGGECSAATVAALRALVTDPAAQDLRHALTLGPGTNVGLIATEGPTGRADHRGSLPNAR